MKRLSILIAIFIAATTFYNCNKSLKSNTHIISPKETQTLLQNHNVQLIDIRTPKEFKTGHIENAQNIDFLSLDFSEEIKKLNKKQPVIIYCRSGRRSALSTTKFLDAGFTEIYDLQGGIIKWKKQGFKIQNHPKSSRK
ncbi:rhodanese-like domain-containing protein [Gelatiniphilus marinus]|uniref:Rhodanese-like domain-containing protein n=1 Tax=Gelatiniphilus marinus TaxID=1759464 RepID=A0ABW5JM94_9FLAO